MFLSFKSDKNVIAGVKHPGDHIKFSLLGDYSQVLDLWRVCKYERIPLKLFVCANIMNILQTSEKSECVYIVFFQEGGEPIQVERVTLQEKDIVRKCP